MAYSELKAIPYYVSEGLSRRRRRRRREKEGRGEGGERRKATNYRRAPGQV